MKSKTRVALILLSFAGIAPVGCDGGQASDPGNISVAAAVSTAPDPRRDPCRSSVLMPGRACCRHGSQAPYDPDQKTAPAERCECSDDQVSCESGMHWTELSLAGGPNGVVLNSGPVVNYDRTSGRLIVFYPSNPSVSGVTSQVWLLDHANGLGGAPTWTQLPVGGDLPNNINGNTTVVYTPQNQLLLYGGCEFNCSPAQSDVYQLSNANGSGGPAVWSRVNIAVPRARSGHQSAFDPTTNKMITFGGNLAFFGTDQNDTAILDTSTSSWSTPSITGAIPSARAESFSSAYDTATQRFMIFGGSHLISTCCPYDITQSNDLWVLENATGGGTPVWQQLSPTGTAPSPRGGNSAVFDSVHDRLLIYGGSTWSNATQSYTPLGDLWQVTHANGMSGQAAWSQLSPTGDIPGPLPSFGAAFDAASQRMMLFGSGDATTNTPSRVWVLVPQDGSSAWH